MIGGWDGDINNDVWYSDDGATWHRVPLNRGDRYTARANHQVVVHNDRLWVIGGYDGNDAAEGMDVWSSEDGETWVDETDKIRDSNSNSDPTKQEVLKAQWHQVVSFEDELWLIGSVDNSEVWSSSDGSTWQKRARVGANIANDTFRTVHEDTGNPPRTHEGLHRRHSSQAVVHNGELWVIGGREDFSYENDVWRMSKDGEWDLVVDALHEVKRPYRIVTPGFPLRHLHGFVSYNNRLWVIGGVYSFSDNDNEAPFYNLYRNDVWRSEDGENWQLGFRDVFEFQ